MRRLKETGLSNTEGGEGFVLTNPVPQPMESASVGEFLAAAREHAGLSSSDVATRLRMSAKQIDAIERADYANLPSGTFLRGFVRNYAKAVGANIDEALGILERTHTDALALKATAVVAPMFAAAPIDYPARGEALVKPKSRALIALLLVACLAAVVWYWWNFVRPHRADGGLLREVPVVVQPELASVPVPTVPVSSAADTPSADAKGALDTVPGIGSVVAPEVKPGQPALSVAASPVSTPIPSPMPSPMPSPPTVPVTPPAKLSPMSNAKSDQDAADRAQKKKLTEAGANDVLGFTFTAESWIEVVDVTGKTVVSRRYKAGEADEVSGRGPFSVVVGNAQATRMTLNGRGFDLKPHTRATVARFTVK
jgi:cytoskeleton protein RodZ